MTIDMSKGQESLYLMVKGSLNTTTSPQLEKELKENLEEVSLLTIDFTELDYISSAGLRVLLYAHKFMIEKGGSMVIKGANELIRDDFTITGFSDILTIL